MTKSPSSTFLRTYPINQWCTSVLNWLKSSFLLHYTMVDISHSHSSDYKNYRLLGCDTMYNEGGFCTEWWCQLLKLHSISGRWTKFDCEAQMEWQGQGKTKALEEKALSQCQFVHTNPIWIGPWLNTGFPSYRPVTNCLSHGMPRNNLLQLKWPDTVLQRHSGTCCPHLCCRCHRHSRRRRHIIIIIIISILQTALGHFCHKGIQGE